MPEDYERVLLALKRAEERGLEGDDAIQAAFEENVAAGHKSKILLLWKPTGFLEHDRSPIPDRAPLDRIKDWDEIHEDFQENKLKEQGARCMDCGTHIATLE